MEFNFNLKTLAQGVIGGFILGIFLLVFYLFFPNVWGSLIYPLKYPSEIEKCAKEYGLDKNMIAGLIFTESGFNPKSVSPAGATGLMQIMPGTAQGVAERIGDQDFKREKLFDPETNIRYGCFYLKEKFETYNRDLTLVLIAYNAGEGTADQYRQNPNPDILPLETQGFIRRVRAISNRYQQVYGNEWVDVERGGLVNQIRYWLVGE